MAHATTSLLALSGTEIMRLVEPETVVNALVDGFKALSDGKVQAPPRPKVEVPEKGMSLAMLAWTPGQMITLKTVNVFHGNHALGVESHQALVCLFDAATGVPTAILDGASLTALRTTAAAILSVRLLARKEAKTALVIGSGVQAREHVRQLHLARSFDEIRIYARNPELARELADPAPNCVAVPNLEAATRTSDVICLTTSSQTPVIANDWIADGCHITSVGFAPPGSELPLELIDRSRLFVEAITAFSPAPVGCAELAGRNPAQGAEIGEVLLGRKPGRSSDAEVTLYKSMGNAMEDMIVANLAYNEAIKTGAGSRVEL